VRYATGPWDGYQQANLVFCEKNLHGLVAQPANTWSNIGFFVVAVWIARRARRERACVAGLLAPIALLTGVGSIAFHATGTLAGQLVDQSTMFFESAFFIVVNLRRARFVVNRRASIAIYVVLVGSFVASLMAFPMLGIRLFVVQVVGFLGLEAYVFVRRLEYIRYRALVAVGVCFVVQYALWWLDRLRVLCDPNNHVFGGHAAWHLLGALSFVFWYRHYAQVDAAPANVD
jgi:Ceramidase